MPTSPSSCPHPPLPGLHPPPASAWCQYPAGHGHLHCRSPGRRPGPGTWCSLHTAGRAKIPEHPLPGHHKRTSWQEVSRTSPDPACLASSPLLSGFSEWHHFHTAMDPRSLYKPHGKGNGRGLPAVQVERPRPRVRPGPSTGPGLIPGSSSSCLMFLWVIKMSPRCSTVSSAADSSLLCHFPDAGISAHS